MILKGVIQINTSECHLVFEKCISLSQAVPNIEVSLGPIEKCPILGLITIGPY